MSLLFRIAIVTAIGSAGLILLLFPILRRYALAHPNARSSHHVSTPQGAGIGVIAATIAASIASAAFASPPPDHGSFAIALGATAMITVVGAIDDTRAIAILPRLLLHVLAATAVVASLPPDLHVVSFLPWWVERLVLLIAGIWFINLTNFMDGIDWMTVAEFVPLTAGLALLGWHGALPIEGTVVAAALCGGLIGFAPFNRPVARIFLGDVGSLPIGLLVGWLLMLLAGNGHLAAALILPLYYLADATLTLLRRVSRGEPFWQAHRTHFYQRATDRGFSVLAIVARVFALNLVLVGIAAATVFWPSLWLEAASLTGAVALVAVLLLSFRRGRS